MPIKATGLYSHIKKAFVLSDSEQVSVAFRRGANAMVLRAFGPID